MKKYFIVLGLMIAAGLSIPTGAYAMELYHSPNFYEDYIIQHESSGRAWAVNSIGCTGLMQACPGSKLSNVCPAWYADIPCQLSFFTNYMQHRYGSWYMSYLFHIRNGWW